VCALAAIAVSEKSIHQCGQFAEVDVLGDDLLRVAYSSILRLRKASAKRSDFWALRGVVMRWLGRE